MSDATTPQGQLPAYSDFTHREMRPDHVGTPTPKGVPYPVNMSPQKAAKLLVKAAAKPGLGQKKHTKGKTKGHGKNTKTIAKTVPVVKK